MCVCVGGGGGELGLRVGLGGFRDRDQACLPQIAKAQIPNPVPAVHHPVQFVCAQIVLNILLQWNSALQKYYFRVVYSQTLRAGRLLAASVDSGLET